MSLSAFKKLKKTAAYSGNIADATIRDFSGGLKVSDNEIALKNKYATVLKNLYPEEDTSQVLRFGTKAFAQCSASIVNQIYFNDHIIAALVTGDIQVINDAGIVTTVWNETIANALSGNPSGWSVDIVSVDFTEFRGDLIVTNGIDKPLIISQDLTVDYLQDIPTGNNVFVPIARYCATVNNYIVLAGVPGYEAEIFISATGSSGTWPGDLPPNDSISFNVGAYAGQASSQIQAISTFKNYLLVFFDNLTIVLELGIFNSEGIHIPEVIDTYTKVGTISNKTIVSTNNDIIFPANAGVHTGQKTVFGGTLDIESITENLGVDYQATLGFVDAECFGCFAIHDIFSKTIFFIFHLNNGTVKSWGLRYKKTFKNPAWFEITGWNFTSACSSLKGRTFFGEGNMLYQYGNNVFSGEAYYSDYIPIDEEDGTNIDFDWEFPWIDGGNRIKSKQLKKITFDTTGESAFLLQCFVNNFRTDQDGDDSPAVAMNFIAGNTTGYGGNFEGYGGDEYGGGRRANDERFYGLPLKFKIIKFRIKGSANKSLRFSSLSMIYARGNYN